MAIKSVGLFLLCLILHGFVSFGAGEYRGFVELDDLNFDKIIKKFAAVLVKFDIAYPYGEKHETYAQFAEQLTIHIDDLLVAAVGIKDYGDKENSQLAERFAVESDYPTIKLFRNGDANDWVDYPKDKAITLENLRLFIREHSSVYMVLIGCLEQYDYLAKRFTDTIAATSAPSTEAQAIINEAEEQQTQLSVKDQTTAKIYVIMMKRILEKGSDFVQLEKKRQRQLLNGKLSDNKKKEVQQKLNILTAFEISTRSQKSHTDEL